MNLNDRISSFAGLGEVLRNSLDGKGIFSDKINSLIENHHIKNPWFSPEYVRMAIEAISKELTTEKLLKWTSAYPQLSNSKKPMNIAVIMAGNIPAVGFHDMLSVLISGNNLQAKLSSKDPDILPLFAEILNSLNSDFVNKITLTEGQLSQFDALIATGSDNSARYFEYYFGKYPHIIRKNRNSIAILEGNENETQLEELGKDIFSYYGLGCRNVSKIFVPDGYDLKELFKRWNKFETVISNIKYANNYDFNKAVYLVNKEKLLDTGYLLIKQDSGLSSPVAVLYYETYSTSDDILILTETLKDKIQCIAGKNYLSLGSTQYPFLWDYADGVDTLQFLTEKKLSENILL